MAASLTGSRRREYTGEDVAAVYFIDDPRLYVLTKGAMEVVAPRLECLRAGDFGHFSREVAAKAAAEIGKLAVIVDAGSVLTCLNGAFVDPFRRWFASAEPGLRDRMILVRDRNGPADAETLDELVGELQPYIRQSLIRHEGSDQEYIDLVAAAARRMFPPPPSGMVKCVYCGRMLLIPPYLVGNAGAGEVEIRVTEEEIILLETLMDHRGGIEWKNLSDELVDRMRKDKSPDDVAVQQAISRISKKLAPCVGHRIKGGVRYEWQCGCAPPDAAQPGVPQLADNLSELADRDLGDRELVAMLIDDKTIDGGKFVAAVGVDREGRTRPAGLWEGATADAGLRERVIADLSRRRLASKGKCLFVLGGGRLLASGLKRKFKSKAVIHGGPLRLHLPDSLRRSLTSMAFLKKPFEDAREVWKVSRWRDGSEVKLWAATALLEDEKSGRRLETCGAAPGYLQALSDRDLTGPRRPEEDALREIAERSLGALKLKSVWIDNVTLGEHEFVVAVGKDGQGVLCPLAVWDGRTSSAEVCGRLLADLAARRLSPRREYLFVMDGLRVLRCRLEDLEFGDAQQMKTDLAKKIGRVTKPLNQSCRKRFRDLLAERLAVAYDLVEGLRQCEKELDHWNGRKGPVLKAEARRAADLVRKLLDDEDELDIRLYSAGRAGPIKAAFDDLTHPGWPTAGKAQLWAAVRLLDAEQGRDPVLLRAMESRIAEVERDYAAFCARGGKRRKGGGHRGQRP